MKILTKEEEQAHYNATLKGGITGGMLGLAVGGAAVFAAQKRFPTFRQLTLPMKTFLVTSSGTFTAIIAADRASRGYETQRDPQRQYRDKSSSDLDAVRASESTWQRVKDWGRENRYPIVTASWVASLGVSLGIVGRSPYLTKAQKLVQARVYAQGLTLAILIATAAFEVGDAKKGTGRWETVKILDPDDPEHKHIIEKRIHHEAYAGEDMWRDMVAAEEKKIAAREKAVKEEEASHQKSSSKSSSSPRSGTGNQTLPNERETKHKIASEHKSAGKISRQEAEEKEAAKAERQGDRDEHAKKTASVEGSSPKSKDRNQY